MEVLSLQKIILNSFSKGYFPHVSCGELPWTVGKLYELHRKVKLLPNFVLCFVIFQRLFSVKEYVEGLQIQIVLCGFVRLYHPVKHGGCVSYNRGSWTCICVLVF